jgi:hypothetical protein
MFAATRLAFYHWSAAIRTARRRVQRRFVVLSTRGLGFPVNQRAQSRNNPILHVPLEEADYAGKQHRGDQIAENYGKDSVLEFERRGHTHAWSTPTATVAVLVAERVEADEFRALAFQPTHVAIASLPNPAKLATLSAERTANLRMLRWVGLQVSICRP